MSADNAGSLSAAGTGLPLQSRVQQTAVVPKSGSGVMPRSPSSVAAARAEIKAPERPRLNVDLAETQRNLREAIDRLNEQMQKNGRDLRFSIDNKVDRTVVTVRSAQTGEIVRQIPDEVVLRVAHSIEDIKGILLNERA